MSRVWFDSYHAPPSDPRILTSKSLVYGAREGDAKYRSEVHAAGIEASWNEYGIVHSLALQHPGSRRSLCQNHYHGTCILGPCQAATVSSDRLIHSWLKAFQPPRAHSTQPPTAEPCFYR